MLSPLQLFGHRTGETRQRPGAAERIDTPSQDPAETVTLQSSPEAPGSSHVVRRVILGTTLGLTVLAGLSGVPASMLPGPIAAPLHVTTQSLVPAPIQHTISNMYGTNADAELPSQYGRVTLVNPNGPTRLIADNGQTSATTNDLPASAVQNNRVIIAVDGIGENLNGSIHGLLQSNQPGSVNVGQPVVDVHEGVGPTRQADYGRVIKDLGYIKTMQAGGSVDTQAVYQNDPAVKAVHDEVKTQLDAGHDVVLIPHSGGGPESALALNILAHEDGGHYQGLISQHVRVMELAAAASPGDYQSAGVQAQNIFYGGDHTDPVVMLAQSDINPANPGPGLAQLGQAFGEVAGMTTSGHDVHSAEHVFHIEGQQRMASFLDGGPGGIYVQ